MVGKSSVSALEEYCAKNKLPKPHYEYIDEDDGSFACQITVMDTEAEGRGRSKRDAKHQAAFAVIKRLRLTDMPDLVDDSDVGIPTTDVVVQLRDYCVQHQMPLPTFEIVQQAGTPDAPEFTALCAVASIRRYGVSEKKKDARQKAAYEMLRIIVDDVNKLDYQMQVATLQSAQEDLEVERYKKFKTYREMTESTTGEMPGVLLCDRHNYFKQFYSELKNAAYKILSSDAYESEQEKALDVLEALKIKPKITKMPTDKAEPLLFIELNCDFDVVFAGPPSKVYQDIVGYFKVML
ncbi:LOW QUALITY PROTEIN: interferon-inducible double-stranded RNA-dependent protein kinase activator A homolog [Rhagoletis pomonella]|uniref:LOW QUALITY PROTEIN: interferon-inducible double-stranded RNA-dependent protein kinase activator A homolog n=1 Tax=Rhagoletis pomonella TaxID=28610 RepID=UPI0017843FBD|nr:LOW QUALITY PROTEIN: interferon-inducible double-stranded RNA-dependent protein kinase activator A homolog [Rhagoletis pomonella]